MAVLLSAGDQVPVIPLLDVTGKGASVPPLQIGATGLNTGADTVPVTDTLIPAVAVHPRVSLTVTL